MTGRALRVLLCRPFTSCSTMTIAAFSDHVHRVVSMGAKKEMIGSDTQWIVASMTDDETVFVDLAKGQLECNTVGVRGNAVIPELPVAVRTHSGGPQPATDRVIDLSHVFPQSFVRILNLVGITTGPRTVFPYLRHEVSHGLATARAWARRFFRANTSTGFVITVSAAIRRDFARATKLSCAADGADILNTRGVVLAVAVMSFCERHI